MAAAAGITTSGQPPTATVNIQPGMNVQPVVLVDQNGNYVTPGGSSTTAGSLATTTVPVNVAAATAPMSGQVLTATSGTTATWQTSSAGFANPMTTLGDMITENSVPTAARLAGNTTSTQMFLAQTGTGSASALPTWSTIATSNLPVIPIAGGGSGQTTATSAFNALNPMTTLGDTIAENSVPTAVRVSGNTTATKNFYTQTGTGSASALPVWGTIAAGDLPTATTSTKGAVILDGTATDITQVGTALGAGAVGQAADAGHTHPYPATLPADHSLITWTYDPALCVNSTAVTGGTMYLAKIFIRKAVTITNLWFILPVAQSSPTVNQNFILLYSSDGTTLLGNTASGAIDTAIQTAGFISQAMSSTYSAAVGAYWIGVLLSKTSGNIGRSSGNTGLTFNYGVSSGSGLTYALDGTTGLQSSTPPSTVASFTASGSLAICVGCS